MQAALGGAGIFRRLQFRPGEIGSQQIVGDQQPALWIAIGQVVAAGEPEIGHRRAGGGHSSNGPAVAGSSHDGVCNALAKLRRSGG